MTQHKLLADFNRYFTSSNGVDVPDRVSVPRDEWRALHAALSSQGAGEAAQPARVVDLAIEALEMLEPYVDRLVDYSSTSAEWPMNRAPVKVQVALSALRSAKLSTPPAAPTTSQQADGWATARAQDSSDYSREHLTDEPQAVAVTELEDVKRWFMNQETGMLVQTERGPWVRYVDVLAAFEAKKAGGV